MYAYIRFNFDTKQSVYICKDCAAYVVGCSVAELPTYGQDVQLSTLDDEVVYPHKPREGDVLITCRDGFCPAGALVAVPAEVVAS